MQLLHFEASWDKALSSQDRSYIENIFDGTKHLNNSGVVFSPIREAVNHKEELLVSVLIHNFTDQPCTFNNVRLLYKVGEVMIAETMFTLPNLVIPSKVSMPWTFIFPKESCRSQTSFKSGRLEIAKQNKTI